MIERAVMLPRVLAVDHVRDYVLRLTFDDGVVGDVDLADWVLSDGRVVQPLRDITYFRQAAVDRDFGTVTWPNGVDICPDVLYHDVTGAPLPGTDDAGVA